MVVPIRMVRRFRVWRKGTAVIEAAIIFPLLIMLTMGAIHYGWLFLKSQEITNAARNGARVGCRAGANSAEITATVDMLMARAGMAGSGYVINVAPGDVFNMVKGQALEVTVTVPAANVAWLIIPLLPTPENLAGAITMAKEGP
jgi:Flp pilus assembly protein TadG